jgi:hypothetical protein
MNRRCLLYLVFSIVTLSYFPLWAANYQRQPSKKLVIIAGKPSHQAGEHEYNAGALLIQHWFAGSPDLAVTVCLNGWPADSTLVPNADGIVLFMDGKQDHLVLNPNNKRQLLRAASRGAGIAALHYAVTLPSGQGEPLLDLLGGFKEDAYSVHGLWTADFKTIAPHPITRGVKPFRLYDECYFFLRFLPQAKPLLIATPPDSLRNTPASRAFPGRPETIAWVYERADGGRSFGNTAFHFHHNWGDENLRKLTLNALRWMCHLEVPPSGVITTVTPVELEKNLDPK